MLTISENMGGEVLHGSPKPEWYWGALITRTTDVQSKLDYFQNVIFSVLGSDDKIQEAMVGYIVNPHNFIFKASLTKEQTLAIKRKDSDVFIEKDDMIYYPMDTVPVPLYIPDPAATENHTHAVLPGYFSGNNPNRNLENSGSEAVPMDVDA